VTTPVEAEAVHPPASAIGGRGPRLIAQAELLVVAIFFLTALTSIAVTRNAGGSSLLWPANAIAAALLVRWPTLRWGRVSFGLLLAGTVANVLGANDAPIGSLAMSAADLLEVVLTAYLFRGYARLSFPDITFAAGLRMLGLLGVGLPAVASLFGGLAVSLTFGTPWAQAAANWFTATAAGAILCAPAIYLHSAKVVRRLVSPRVRALNLALALGCFIVTYCAIRYSRFPMITLSIPLIVVAFRVGAFGAALMCEAVGLLVVILWAAGVRTGPAVPLAAGTMLAGIPFLALAAIMISPMLMGFAADDRDRAMRALRFNEQRFRQSLQHSPTGIVMRGLDGKITMVNDAFLKLFGYEREELLALTTEQLLHPDDEVESGRDMRSLMDGTATAYVAERRYRHRDGSWHWVRVAVSLVDGDDGAPMHFIGHVESLEERRRAERDLAEERERLKTTLHAVSEAVITTDALGQITYVNTAAENLIGQRLDEIAGRRLDEVIVLTNPQTMKATASMFALCVARGASVRRPDRCLLHRPDGSPCYVIDTASPVNDPDGAVSGVVVVLQDATAIVERERELSHRAAHDPLTGLTNRFEFERRLAECFERHRHIDRISTLLLIDLDRFKAVNDTSGHAAGDEVLRRVARTLSGVVRDSDTVSRLGGDEFALLVTHTDPGRAELVGAKVLRAVAELSVDWNGARHSVGASIGIASLTAGIAGVSEWIAAADRACYEAKRAGRGQMRIAA
jgi:diguanylate cyclase (GGDEF)-like protein/PAS domain S-box-containing protein